MASTSGHLNLTQLATLRELSRLGTLAAVADSLGYTAGAVSQHLSTLERSVGERLVERAGRNLVLTGAGHVLAGYAETILGTEREARRAVAALGGRTAGPLRVGTWGSTAATLLTPVIKDLARRHPEVTVRSREVDLDEAASAVRRGLVDAAFGLDYADAPLPRERGIDIVELHEEPFSIAVAAASAPADDDVVDAEVLAGLSWILPPASSQFGTAIRTGFRNRGFEPVVLHEVTDTGASLALAAGGLGATVMTPLMRRLAPAVELAAMSMRDPLTRRIVLLVPSDHSRRPVTAFTEVVSDVVRSLLTGARA
jgi:DNA-binding transcriptional LysR family regulator